MSDMPERILAWREEDEYIDHVLINKCWGGTSEVPSWDATEYIRADLMAELVEAAEGVDDFMRTDGAYERSGYGPKLRAALAKIKEPQHG